MKMKFEKIVKDILKTAASRKVDLGPGVECSLKDTADKLGYRISIEGSFRHGGGSMEEVIKILLETWKKLDIDA
jgi:hypothetical protein